MTTVLEGTWEEIKSHDVELTGRNVRLIIESEFVPVVDLPASSDLVRNIEHLEALLQEGLDSGPMTPVTAADRDDIRREGRMLAVHNPPKVDA